MALIHTFSFSRASLSGLEGRTTGAAGALLDGAEVSDIVNVRVLINWVICAQGYLDRSWRGGWRGGEVMVELAVDPVFRRCSQGFDVALGRPTSGQSSRFF